MQPEVFKNKAELKKIMSGAVRVNSKSMDISKIRLYCATEEPSFRVVYLFYVCFLTSLWIALIGLVWMLNIERISEAAYLCGPAALVTGLLSASSALLYRRKKASVIKEGLEAPFAELSALGAYLEQYTKNMRRRTQTIFRSLNEDSLKNLIYLDNIRIAIVEKCKYLKFYLSQEQCSYNDMIQADYILRSYLKVYVSPELLSRENYKIDMSDLRDIVETFIANMELGLNKMEYSRQIDFSSTVDTDF